jgi:hypothetical protein
MEEKKVRTMEEVVNAYLNSENENYINDFCKVADYLNGNNVNDGELVDKVVKHYYGILSSNGDFIPDCTPNNETKKFIAGKDLLKQWVGSIDNETRKEKLELFNQLYKKANIHTKIGLYAEKERKNVELAKAMQMRGEKVKKEDFNIDESDGSSKLFSKALNQIDSMGASMVKNVYDFTSSIDEWNDDVFNYTDEYANQCHNLIQESNTIQFDNQQKKNNYLKAMYKQAKYHLNIAFSNIEQYKIATA